VEVRHVRSTALLFVALAVAGLAGCGPDLRGTVEREALLEVLESNLVVLPDGGVPAAVTEALGDHRVIVVGEYHGVSGHQDFVAALVGALRPAGLDTLLLEFPQAYSWLLDGYARGSVDALLDGAERTYGTLLREVRAVNAELPPDERVRVAAIDLNPSREDFLGPFRGVTAQLGRPALLQGFLDALESGESYEAALARLTARVEGDRDELEEAWGERAVVVLQHMLDAEARSLPVRALRTGPQYDRARERVMGALVDARLAETEGRVLVNVGYFHAQKRPLFGTVDTYLGEYLVDASPHARGTTYLLVVAPAAGERVVRGRAQRFDVERDSPENELFRLMAELAGEHDVFVPLDVPLFSEERVVVNYHSDFATVPPKTQFDGFVLLRRVAPTAH
jgi:hypothetical protein